MMKDPLESSADHVEMVRICNGLAALLKAVLFQYIPSQRGILARKLEAKLPEGRHKGKKLEFEKSAAPSEPGFYIRKGISGSLTAGGVAKTISLAENANTEPAHAAYAMVITGSNSTEIQSSIQALVEGLDIRTAMVWNNVKALSGIGATDGQSEPRRIALSSDDTAIWNETDLQHRATLARLFEKELQESEDDDAVVPPLISYTEIPTSKKDAFDTSQKHLEGNSSSGFTTRQARDDLGIPADYLFPRIQDMRLDKPLKDHQLEGIAWILPS